MSDRLPKKRIESSVEAILKKPWCRELKIVIGGKSNYRNDIVNNYKTGRPPKPQRFKPLRDWVIETYSPTISENCEADDVVSTSGWKSFNKAKLAGDKDEADVVIIGIDKDNLQAPGWHYNYSHHEANPKWVSEFEANRNFFVQLLLGDDTDNIKALTAVRSERLWYKKPKNEWSNCGEKKAKYLIGQCQSTKEMLLLCEELYKEYFNVYWEYKISTAFSLLRLMEEEGIIPDYSRYREIII